MLLLCCLNTVQVLLETNLNSDQFISYGHHFETHLKCHSDSVILKTLCKEPLPNMTVTIFGNYQVVFSFAFNLWKVTPQEFSFILPYNVHLINTVNNLKF